MSSSTTVAIPSGTLVVNNDVPRSRPLVPSVPAEFYSLSSDDGMPIAGLIVLNDSGRRPVRAELHLVGAATEEIGRQAIRQAQHILEDRYRGPEALPMQVWQSFLRSDPLEVPLPPGEKAKKAAAVSTESALAEPQSSWSLPSMASILALPWKLIGAVAGAVLLALLVWSGVNWLRGGDTADVSVPASGGVETADAGGSALTVAPILPETAGQEPQTALVEPVLAPSINAHPDLLVGKRIRVKPNVVALTLRTEAGAEAGSVQGYMEGGDEATIVGGPKALQGISDTIVWWEVQLDDGQQAWAPANTSQQQLLEPME